jgi:hypothetical protein
MHRWLKSMWGLQKQDQDQAHFQAHARHYVPACTLRKRFCMYLKLSSNCKFVPFNCNPHVHNTRGSRIVHISESSPDRKHRRPRTPCPSRHSASTERGIKGCGSDWASGACRLWRLPSTNPFGSTPSEPSPNAAGGIADSYSRRNAKGMPAALLP